MSFGENVREVSIRNCKLNSISIDNIDILFCVSKDIITFLELNVLFDRLTMYHKMI